MISVDDKDKLCKRFSEVLIKAMNGETYMAADTLHLINREAINKMGHGFKVKVEL